MTQTEPEWLAEIQKERDALAAHVERWHDVYVDLTNNMVMFDGVSHYVADNAMMRRFDEIDESAPTTSLARHPDDAAVDRFAAAMKAKLAGARAKGRDGWDDPDRCSAELLADLLVGHVGKGNAGNMEDIANLAMMLHQRGDDPAMLATSLARIKAQWQADLLDFLESRIKPLHQADNGAQGKGYNLALEDCLACIDMARRQAEGGADGEA